MMSKKMVGVCPGCEVEDNIYMTSVVTLTPVELTEGLDNSLKIKIVLESPVDSIKPIPKFYCSNCYCWFDMPKMVK